MSLRSRILLAMLTVAAVALVLGGLVARQAVRTEFSTVVDVELEESDVDRVDRYRERTGSWEGVEPLLAELDELYALRMILTDDDEAVVADSRPGDALPPLDVLPAYSLFYTDDGAREDFLFFTIEVLGPSETGTDGSAESLASIDRRFLLAGLGSMAIAGLTGLWLAGLITKPVRGLSEAVAGMRAGATSSRADDGGPGELGTLASSFNALADDLERSETNRQAMIADAAHELRTPLANLKGHLEAVSDGVIEPDNETIAGLVGDVERLGRLVDDLQALSLAEADAITLDIVEIEPAVVLGRVAAAHSARAAANGVQITVSSPSDLAKIAVDENRINQVLGNLVSNAMRYGDRVELSARRDGGWVAIDVADNGDGIPADQLDRIFDRFHRTDPSRHREGGTTAGGGLGLAIVSQLVRLHGGEVSVTSTEAPSPGHGATFTVRLPASG